MNLHIRGHRIAIVIAFTVVAASPKLLRADRDDVLDTEQAANLSAFSGSESGDVINNNSFLGTDGELKQDTEYKNREGSKHAAGLSTESGQDFHNSQPDQPASVWIIRSTPSRRGLLCV